MKLILLLTIGIVKLWRNHVMKIDGSHPKHANEAGEGERDGGGIAGGPGESGGAERSGACRRSGECGEGGVLSAGDGGFDF